MKPTTAQLAMLRRIAEAGWAESHGGAHRGYYIPDRIPDLSRRNPHSSTLEALVRRGWLTMTPAGIYGKRGGRYDKNGPTGKPLAWYVSAIYLLTESGKAVLRANS